MRKIIEKIKSPLKSVAFLLTAFLAVAAIAGCSNGSEKEEDFGEKGYVTNHSLLAEKYDCICTCGPKPMMMAVARYARENGIACEVSLENKMACGLGACLCCVEDTKEGHKCVCTDGPVFSIDELKW